MVYNLPVLFRIDVYEAPIPVAFENGSKRATPDVGLGTNGVPGTLSVQEVCLCELHTD